MNRFFYTGIFFITCVLEIKKLYMKIVNNFTKGNLQCKWAETL